MVSYKKEDKRIPGLFKEELKGEGQGGGATMNFLH